MTVGTVFPRRFVLVCYHDNGHKISAEWTYWPNREQAEQARDQLTPCGPRCLGVHAVAATGREIDTATTTPTSGDSTSARPNSAPSARNVNRHSPIQREEACGA